MSMNNLTLGQQLTVSANRKPKRPSTSNAGKHTGGETPVEKIQLFQVLNQAAPLTQSLNSNRRISLVMPPHGGKTNENRAPHGDQSQKKKTGVEKKRVSTATKDSGSVERVVPQKFSIQGYISNEYSSMKRKSSLQGSSKQSKPASLSQTATMHIGSKESLKQRNSTLSPPPMKEKPSAHILKSNSKNGNSSQTRQSNKRMNYLKSLVKKQQQKSLSRDFQNASSLTSSQGPKSTVNALMYKSQNQSLQTAMMANSLYTTGNSLSPNNRGTSSQKKKTNDKKKKFKCDDLTSISLQQLLFKPPLNTTKNATAVNNYLQSSLQLKSGGFQTLINEAKESVPLRQTTNEPASNTQAKRKQLRSSTQERVLKMAEAEIENLNFQIDSTQKKQPQVSHSLSEISMKKQNSKRDEPQKITEYSDVKDKRNKSKHVESLSIGSSAINQTPMQNHAINQHTESSLNLLNKTFNDIIDSIQQQSVNSPNPLVQKKQQANVTLIKSQLELIKGSYEQIIKKLQEVQNCSSQSARDNRTPNIQRLLSDRAVEDEKSTTNASLNECLSSQSTFRNNQFFGFGQNQINLQQKIQELESQNAHLQQTLKQKNETILHQQQVINIFKTEPKKEDFGCQTLTAQQEDIITERKEAILIENELLNRQMKKMEKKLDYHKNKENKFLFFLFSLQNKGIPVNEIYEKEGIKDIPTARFSEIMADEQAMMGNNQSSVMFSFYSDDSYELIKTAPEFSKKEAPKKKKINVPSLNFNNLPEYESSSEEEDNNLEEKQEAIIMNTQDYQESMKYIENFYNKQAQFDTNEGTPEDEEEEEEEMLMAGAGNGSSLMFDKEGSNVGAHMPPGSMLDDDFCYSIDKNTKRRSASNEMRSL